MCRSKREGQRRCDNLHRTVLTPAEKEERRLRRELAAENARNQAVSLNLTPEQKHDFAGQLDNQLFAEGARDAILSPSPEPENAAEELLAKLGKGDSKQAGRGCRNPRSGQPAQSRQSIRLNKNEAAAAADAAAVVGLHEAEYAARKITGQSLFVPSPGDSEDFTVDRAAWLAIPLEDRQRMVRARRRSDESITKSVEDLTEHLRELEGFIITSQGKEGMYELVGEAMRERKLLNLDLTKLKEEQREEAARAQQAARAAHTELRAALERRGQVIQAIEIAMSAFPKLRGRPSSRAFLVGLNLIHSSAARKRLAEAERLAAALDAGVKG